MSSAATRHKGAHRAGGRSGRGRPTRRARSSSRLASQPTGRIAQQAQTSRCSARPHWGALARVSAATGGAALICVVLAHVGLAASINDEASAIGFDPERAQFIQFALMTLIGSLLAGVIVRVCLPAWLGGLLYYSVGYVIPYAAQAQHPVLAADGAPQLLVPGAFALNIATLLAVAFILAGAGAVLGRECGKLVVKPLDICGRFFLARAGLSGAIETPEARRLRSALPALALTMILVTALGIAVLNVGTILNYGTTATIYQPAQAALERGVIRPDIYRSPALGGSLRQFLIYLPPSYAASPERRYPVMYLLHGVPGSMTNWFGGANADTTANDLFSLDKARETIFVSPDGNGPVYKASEWANSLDGRQKMEDSVVYDLVPYVDAHYRTIADPADRALAGISDGGFAAVNIALHHPGVFGSVLSLGGFFHADKSAVYGWGSLDDPIHRYNSPSVYVTLPEGLTAARSINFFLGVATGDGPYYRDGMAFYKELQRLGAHVELISASGGHSWQTWGAQFARALPLLEPPLAQNPQPHTR